MKKTILKKLSLLCLFIALTAIYKPVMAQQNPPPDTTQWHISELSSPDAIFPEVQRRANAYFDAHPEMDSLNPLEKMAFKRWEDFWRNRANINGASQPGNLKDVLNAMNNNSLYSYQQDLTAITLPSKWMLITPDEFETQNLGTVTAIWSNPDDENFILIGTETSGLWKTTNGGLNWSNITDSYNMTNSNYMTAAGFGVSSIAVDYNALTKTINAIYISTSLPNTDLILGYGANILKTTDLGASWNILTSYNSYLSNNTSTYYKNMVWKILFFENNLYAAIGKRIVVFDPNTYSFNTIFELGVNSSNPLNPDCIYYSSNTLMGFPICRKIRDFEIFHETGGFQICLTTDGLGTNMPPQGPNAEVYHCTHSGTPYTGVFNWTRYSLTPANGGFIDNAAVEAYNNVFYIAYDEKILNTSNNAYFKIDKLISGNMSNIFYHTHDLFTNYPEESLVVNSTNGGFFNGFGYRYDAFEAVNDKIMYVGGFNVTKIDLTAAPPDVISMNNENILNNNNFNKNIYCHNGIRVIYYQGIINSEIQTLVGNEGGISKTIRNNYFININGKGLAINEFTNLTTTHTNNRDVIVASAIRNGLWHFEQGANNNKWRQFYWEDGGNSLIKESAPSTIYNCASWWDASSPGYTAHLSPGGFHNTTTGLIYTASPIANPAVVCPSLIFQEEIQGASGYYPPIEPSPSSTTGVYLGKHDLLYSNSNGNAGTWSTISNFPGGSQSNFSHNIQAIEIANNSGACNNRIYVAFADPTWGLDDIGSNPGTNPIRKLWRQVSGVWYDITQNVFITSGQFTLAYNGITDIAINPTNGCELWITLNQFCAYTSQNGKERVLHSTDGGDTWLEFSQGLTPAPVNTIKYFYEDGKRLLFIGTDVGVYYRDLNDATAIWKLLNSSYNPLPRCIVTDIEISYRTKKIRAATLGRGIWETDLLCLNGTYEYTNIDGNSPANTVWNTNKLSLGINIGANKTLTITSNVRFAPGAWLQIAQGGKLILDGGVLEACPNEMWNGVFIYGTPETNPNLFYEANHSIIEIKNNGTIKDALIGIENTGGGVIYMNNANFINNQRAIRINEYTGNIKAEKSYFMNANFKTDQLYHDAAAYPFQYFIELNNVYKLRITGCKFENKLAVANPYLNPNGTGIKSYNAVYTVCDECNNPNPMQQGDPCPAQYTSKSVFTNLNYGIYASNSVKTKNITVKNSIFDNNYRGIYAMNIDNASFTLNTFKIPEVALQPYNQVSYDGAYGLYLMDCSGYTVEANLFDRTDYVHKASVGMIINNSGSALNSIYNNTFKNIRYVATLAQGNNRGTNYDTGLKIKCNDYINNKQDIAVTYPQSGISIYQGANVSNPNDIKKDKKPAGNRFSKIITTGIPDYDNDMGQNITYFYHNAYGNPNNLWVPQYCSSSAKILKTEAPLSIFNKALSCPSIALGTGNIQPNNLSFLMQDFAQNTLDYNSAKLILQIWVDGGNTPDLVQTTELAYPWEAYTLYNELIGLSPYLSDDVLIAAIQNEEGLPPLMLKLVLLANPQAVRSGEVMDALRARNNPFPEEWLEELEQGLEVISPREELEAEVSFYAGERKTYLDLLKQYYLADTSANAMGNLQQLLSAETDIDSRYELVFAQLANNEYLAANTTFENMESILPENDTERSKYYKMKDIISVIKQLNTGQTNWEGIDKSKVIELSETDEDLPGSLARAIRMYNDLSYTYAEPIYVNDSIALKSTTAAKIKKNTGIDDKQSIKLSPNPANDYIIAEYTVDKIAKEVVFLISDIQGRIQITQQLKKITNQTLIDVSKLTNGTYQCKLVIDCQQKAVAKLIVQH